MYTCVYNYKIKVCVGLHSKDNLAFLQDSVQTVTFCFPWLLP